jgi:hypothetical protein
MTSEFIPLEDERESLFYLNQSLRWALSKMVLCGRVLKYGKLKTGEPAYEMTINTVVSNNNGPSCVDVNLINRLISKFYPNGVIVKETDLEPILTD